MWLSYLEDKTIKAVIVCKEKNAEKFASYISSLTGEIFVFKGVMYVVLDGWGFTCLNSLFILYFLINSMRFLLA